MNNETIFVSKVFLLLSKVITYYIASPLFEIVWHFFPSYTATDIEKIPTVLKGNLRLSSTVYSINTAVLDQVLFALSSQITLHTKYQSFFSLYEKWKQRLFEFAKFLKSKMHFCIYLQTANTGLLIIFYLQKTIYFLCKKNVASSKYFFAWTRWYIKW